MTGERFSLAEPIVRERFMSAPPIHVAEEVAAALRDGRAVVALESTLIAHGLPWPQNLETARASEAAVRAHGAVPATIAVWNGRPTVGLDAAAVEHLARTRDARKASSRDLAAAVAAGCHAATTVAATLRLAERAGVRVMATGGIGGVHPPRVVGRPVPDVSADLTELARSPTAVVCAGAKNILDLPATLEVLETHSVPVVGYRTDRFPAFYVVDSGLPVSSRVDTAADAANLLQAHWRLGGAGVVLVQPPPADLALSPQEFDDLWPRAERAATDDGVTGARLTPFLLARLAEWTSGRTLAVNHALIVADSALAAQVAVALTSLDA
jgi:pseudouridine-5'-phosphate glycosidase